MKAKVAKWMLAYGYDYLSATLLAEAAADEFDLGHMLDETDNWLWELALEFHKEGV